MPEITCPEWKKKREEMDEVRKYNEETGEEIAPEVRTRKNATCTCLCTFDWLSYIFAGVCIVRMC